MTTERHPEDRGSRALTIEQAKSVGSLLGVVASAVLTAVDLNLDLESRDNSKFDAQEKATVHSVIVRCSLVFEAVRKYQEAVDVLERDMNPRASLRFLRDPQDSLILLSMGRREDRCRAMTRDEVIKRLHEPEVFGFLRNIAGGTEPLGDLEVS